MKRVLVTGGSSLLGKYLINTAPDDCLVHSTWYTNAPQSDRPAMLQMDVCNESQVAYVFFRVKPDIVIHCAAIGDVDYTEENYSTVNRVNVNGTQKVLEQAERFKSRVVYISTNAVYDGDNPPYAEDSPRNPINAYGSIKKRAEDVVKEYPHYTIVRPCLLYGYPWLGGRQNWATTIISRLTSGKPVRLVNDTFWMPTYVGDCANAIWHIIKSGSDCEAWNVAGGERVTLYEFGQAVAIMFDLDENLVQPISSGELKLKARRPVDTAYKLGKLSMLGVDVSCVLEGLEKMEKEK